MPTSNPAPPQATPVHAQWSFAAPFETPPAVNHIPSIFYTNQNIAQAAQSINNQTVLSNVQRVLQFASDTRNNTLPNITAPLWFSPQMPITVRPMLMPFRSPQTEKAGRQPLSVSDVIDARILENRYGASIACLAQRPAGLTYSAAVNQPFDRRAAKGLHYREITIPLIDIVPFHDHQPRSLTLYQPTPAGVRELLKHTKGRGGWPVEVEVFEAGTTREQPIDARINEFLSTVDWWQIVPSSPHIVILMDGQRHAIPLILSKDTENNRLVIVLDSTAKSSVGLYRRLAAQHSKIEFWLNEGSRQVDAFSCITDAVEVACQAADDPSIVEKVRPRGISTDGHLHLPNSRLRLNSPQTNEDGQLHRFNLPESLAISAQSRQFLNNSALNQDCPIVVNGEASTLKQHLQASSKIARQVYFNSDSSANQAFRVLNCYLYTASERHARVLDALAAARQ